jgi:hypothetical protein
MLQLAQPLQLAAAHKERQRRTARTRIRNRCRIASLAVHGAIVHPSQEPWTRRRISRFRTGSPRRQALRPALGSDEYISPARRARQARQTPPAGHPRSSPHQAGLLPKGTSPTSTCQRRYHRQPQHFPRSQGLTSGAPMRPQLFDKPLTVKTSASVREALLRLLLHRSTQAAVSLAPGDQIDGIG